MRERSKNSLGKYKKHHSEAKRVEAVTTYLVLGKATLVGAALGIPEGTIRQWRTQPWWKELEMQIQTESDQELDHKLAKRIDKALELVNDRLDNGDFQYDPKTGQFVRRPVGARDGWKIASEMIDKRWILRKQPKEQSSQEAVGDILKNLASEFAEMAKRKLTERVINGSAVEIKEELPVGVPELPRETGTNSEPIRAEPSTA
jgi:hypothetical protein